jgi:multicomponent Na+:H+ antiporter subunit B
MRWGPLLLVLLVAAALIAGVAGLPRHDAATAPIHTEMGAQVTARGVGETGMNNLVTAVLLSYRAFDTLVEVVVIFTALAALLALPRGPATPSSDTSTAAVRRAPAAQPGVPVSPVVRFAVQLLAPLAAMFAMAMLFRGHVTPGGGFQAAAVFAAIFIAMFFALGPKEAGRTLPSRMLPLLQALGPLAFAVLALASAWLTGSFLGWPSDHLTQEAFAYSLEIAIGVGGAVILTRLFLLMEEP